jgi:glycosyltransferase involved in cell wall biosynthesis
MATGRPDSRQAPSEPIRVLQVIEATIGGTKRHVLDLLEALASDPSFQVEVACPRLRCDAQGDTSFVDDVRALGIAVHVVPMVRRIDPLRDLAAVWRLAMLLRAGNFDVIHLHSSKAGALGRAAVYLVRTVFRHRPRVVYTPHAFAFLSPGGGCRAGAYTALERFFGHTTTDCLVAVSEDERHEALQRHIVPAHRIQVVRNWLDATRLPAPRQAEVTRRSLGWGRRGGTTVVGAVGRLTAQKDPLTWVRAAALALRGRPDLLFAWIGSGEMRSAAEALARQLLGTQADRVQFLGYQPNAAEIIAALDIFTLTSRFEGLPYVLLEAMALARPVIAAECTGIRDLVLDGSTGLLAPAGAHEALAQRILALASDGAQAARLGRAAKAHALRLARLERQRSAMLGLYHAQASRGSSGRHGWPSLAWPGQALSPEVVQ